MLQSVVKPCSSLPPVLLTVSSRGKKYYPGWRNPFSLTDFDNLAKASPSVPEQWEAEWASTTVVPHELKAFDINRLPHHLSERHRGVPVAVKHAHEKRQGYQRRLFGLYGLASGVDPCELFDSAEDLEREKKIQQLREPDVNQFKQNLAAQRNAEAIKNIQRTQQIEENLKRLPEMLEKFHVNQEKKAAASRAAEEKRRQLLEDARDRFGYYVDRRDPKFIRLMEEREEESKLAKKASRKK